MNDASPILRVQQLVLTSSTQSEAPPLLDGVSFDVERGEIIALVGESGSGKSLTARAILGLLPEGVERRSGEILFQNRALTSMGAADYRKIRGRDIAMVFQEPMVSLNPALKIGQQIAEGLALHTSLTRPEIRTHSIDMLHRVKIKDPERCLEAYPHEFSGGMRQRIMLASVFLLEPKLLIADEPTTALDTLTQREVMDLIVELSRERGVTTVLITHDLGLVSRYASRLVVLEKGVVREKGETAQVLSRPAHAYTQRLISSLPCRGNAPPSRPAEPPLLSVRSVSIDYPGKANLWGASKPVHVIKSVSLEIAAGEIVALVGASGSGKSTLGRAVVDLHRPSEGEIIFDGSAITRMTAGQRREYRHAVQMVFQDPFSSLDPRMRVGDAVAAPIRTEELDRARRKLRVEAVLEEVGLPGYASRFPHQMSGGQRQRVAIARAIISRPRLVVADEPVSALDMTIQAQILSLLQNLQSQYGFACLFITHDLAVVEQIASRVAVMSNGDIIEHGLTHDVLDHPKHTYSQALIAASPKLTLVAQ